ncbi:hypothetical protein [Priestia taiwanensis]|uniref:Toxin/Nuclease N-terminal domain-containing protein n=1 Tax=Priestia taiwanensis TaxID=1347902 RepID=A0A917EP45_9BACI|nr:hypothetical protein [Priestia taiwanensis]MBM7362353.1 hypothetical protein [Priestia taiwanensis]GGE61467.1 hypothetical protein GCM10007140_09750 [Priestia taiwanensis]
MDVRYKHGPWQEMKETIIRLKRDSERTFLQMDDLLGSIERKIDRLDSDRSISFHHTSKKTTINHLFDDYDQLVNYCHRVGETVSRHIDEPFYHKMDEFAGKMRDLSIRNYTTENRIGSTEYKAMPTAHSYGRLETSSVQKDTITIDDIFKDSVAFDEILNLQYEEMKRNNPEAKLDYNEYRKLIPSMRGFEYETMEEEQQDLEMWRDLAIAAGIIVAAVVCPPVAIAATAVFTGLEVKSVVTGEDWGTGRKLSTGEQIERGAFSVLGVIPGVKGVRQAFRGTDDLISLTKQSIAQNLAKFNPNTGKNVVQSLKDSNTYWTHKLRLEGLKATDKLNDVNYAIKGAFARSLDNMNNLAAQSIDVASGGAAALGRGGSNVEDVVKASHLESKGIIQSKIEKIEGTSELRKVNEAEQLPKPLLYQLPNGVEITPNYSREQLSDYGKEGFSSKLDSVLNEVDLSRERFYELQQKMYFELTTKEIEMVKKIRDSVSSPTRDILMQKVITLEGVEGYLKAEKPYNTIGGCIAKMEDVQDIHTPADVFNSLRLDYNGTPYTSSSDYAVIRFKTDSIDEFKIPYAENFGDKTNTKLDITPPQSGHGFTASKTGKVVPEYEAPRGKFLEPRDGAEIYTVINGIEKLVGIYIKDLKRFIPVMGK